MNFRCLASAVALLFLPLVLVTSENVLYSPPVNSFDATKQFNFKSRNVGGKKITVLSLKSDPERGRRSVFVPEGENVLLPASFGRHLHHFISPFDDEVPLNQSLIKIIERDAQIIDEDTKMLSSIQASLTRVKQDLKHEKSLLKNVEDDRKAKKRMEKQRRKAKTRRERKKRRKQRKKEKAILRLQRKKSRNSNRKPRPKLTGNDACRYKMLRRCAKKLKLLPRKQVPVLNDFQKCSQRKKFLECIETMMCSRKKACKADLVVRGNLPGLRTYIKKLFWTTNSCLLNEALKGR